MDNLSAEEIQLRANQVTDESLESTRRILGLAIEYWNMTRKNSP
uniref:Synaptosome associated protein 23 n=1 Tax=Phocoena sinus TaxID=42100 RepID=A0A8C9ATM0_PHOSS